MPAPKVLPPAARALGVTAVLGPTNTGKTHYAIERMLAHGSGMIGLPLRLLAREVYGRVVERVGPEKVALVTGEEKIKPRQPRYWIATAEAMPRDISVDFVALDEIQLAADPDRGHIFTDRLLNLRGRFETLLIGAGTMRPLVERLLPGVTVVTRPRLSQLTFAGEKKITRLPPRTAIVAFSAEEVYAIAELIRRQKGGAAVVLGALSPRTRNAQVAMYQAGEVDYLVATDAIGMGLNLDVDHVAFAAERKFDGARHRPLTPAELGQVAGRAGRHLRDGTFGTTGRCLPFDPELAAQIEDHAFEPLTLLQWRNPELDFTSLPALQASLARQPNEPGLARAAMADDEVAFEIAARDPDVRRLARGLTATGLLWQVAQLPDYGRLATNVHAELVVTIFRYLMERRRVPDDWFARQVGKVDRTDGDIDTLSARIAQVRTWTFVANRPDWLSDPEHWQGVTRQVEDKLSDALHERLAQRFVDRRTSVLMRRLRENAMLEAEITQSGDVMVEGQHVGALQGFLFTPDASASADSQEGRALRAAATKALAGEIETRAERFANAVDDSIVLANDGVIRWLGDPVAKLAAGEKALSPRARILGDEHLSGPAREKVERRLATWIEAHVKKLLAPLLLLEDAPADVTGIARGIAFQLAEGFGVLERARVGEEVKGLDQPARAALRGLGVRFGAYHLYLPALMKPAPRTLACQLWTLKHGDPEQKGLAEIAHLAASGRTSIPVDKEISRDLYRVGGFRVCGERAVRVDILERLADLIRPAIAYRPGTTPGEPPAGAADQDGFVVTVAMTSLAGCAGEDFASILKSLGYVLDRRKGPAITKPLLAAASQAPIQPVAPAEVAPQAQAAEDTPAPEETAAILTPSDEMPAAALEAASADTEAAIQPDVPAEAQAAEASAVAEPASVETASTEIATAEEAQAAAATADAEPELIEVWRPHRQHQGGGRNRTDQRRAGNRRPEGQAGEPGRAREGEPARRQGPRPGPGPERAPGEGRREGERGPGRPEGQRRDDRGPRRFEGGRPEGGRPGQDSRPRQDGRPRPEGKGGGRNERRGSWQDAMPAPKPRAERAPDPDSPFAKLAALKAALEGKPGNDKT